MFDTLPSDWLRVRSQRANAIKERNDSHKKERKVITEQTEADLELIEEAVDKLQAATSDEGPFEHAVQNEEFLQAKADFLEGIYQVKRLTLSLANVKQNEEQAIATYDSIKNKGQSTMSMTATNFSLKS